MLLKPENQTQKPIRTNTCQSDEKKKKEKKETKKKEEKRSKETNKKKHKKPMTSTYLYRSSVYHFKKKKKFVFITEQAVTVTEQETEEIIYRFMEKWHSFMPAEDLIHTVAIDYRF